MASFTIDISINRPREEVFSAATDARSQPQWDKGLLEGAHDPDGPVWLGSKVLEARRVFGRTQHFTDEITAFEAGRRIVREGHTPPFTTRGQTTVAGDGGSTDLHLEWRLTMSPAPLRVVEPLVAAIFKRQFLAIFHELKNQLESGEFVPAG